MSFLLNKEKKKIEESKKEKGRKNKLDTNRRPKNKTRNIINTMKQRKTRRLVAEVMV